MRYTLTVVAGAPRRAQLVAGERAFAMHAWDHARQERPLVLLHGRQAHIELGVEDAHGNAVAPASALPRLVARLLPLGIGRDSAASDGEEETPPAAAPLPTPAELYLPPPRPPPPAPSSGHDDTEQERVSISLMARPDMPFEVSFVPDRKSVV